MRKEEGTAYTIYCLRDRMVDYYMQPFAAQDDKAVMSAVARIINTPGDNNDPVAQAPHHFEIWKLCYITELGNAYAAKEFIADCGSLVRTGRQPAIDGTAQVGRTIERLPSPDARPGGDTSAQERRIESQVQAGLGVRAKKAKRAARATKR